VLHLNLVIILKRWYWFEYQQYRNSLMKKLPGPWSSWMMVIRRSLVSTYQRPILPLWLASTLENSAHSIFASALVSICVRDSSRRSLPSRRLRHLCKEDLAIGNHQIAPMDVTVLDYIRMRSNGGRNFYTSISRDCKNTLDHLEASTRRGNNPCHK
jgi:hypothetical protein